MKQMIVSICIAITPLGFQVGCSTAATTTTGSTASKTAVPTALPAPADKTAAPYIHSKPGFHVELDKKDGRLWVFKEGSDDLKSYQNKGKPAKHVLRPGAGPLGITLKSAESETITEYIATKPGFHVELDKKDGRLWVFKEGSDDLKSYQTKGKPAKHVLRPGAGPLGITLKSAESETIIQYLVSRPGFHVELDEKDGRLWVFKEGSEDLHSFINKGKPAKQVLRPGVGPLGMTLKSTDASILDAYQASL